jgi:hypothetical protein
MRRDIYCKPQKSSGGMDQKGRGEYQVTFWLYRYMKIGKFNPCIEERSHGGYDDDKALAVWPPFFSRKNSGKA